MSHLIEMGTALIVSPFVTMKASPLAIDIMANVTMNGGMRRKVMNAPFRAPAAAHAPIVATMHSVSPTSPAVSPPPRSRISRAQMTAERATRLPTERSMPPAMMTIVMPMAIIAIITI